MTWLRFSDTVAERPVWETLGSDAFMLHVAALGYSNRQQVEGRLTRAQVRRLTFIDDPLDVAAKLVDRGVWDETDDGFAVVHDLSDQLDADEVERMRRLAAERAKRKRMHAQRDHSMCLPSYCRFAGQDLSRDASRDESRDASRDESQDSRQGTQPIPTRPVPSRPVGTRDGSGTGSADPAHGSAAPDLAERKKCPHGFALAKDGSGCPECSEEIHTSLRVIVGGESA